MASRAAMANAPDVYSAVLLEADQKKLTAATDLRTASSMVYNIALEDYTLAGLLRSTLLCNNEVRFAGYRKIHPLINEVEIRVTTTSKQSPDQAFEQAIVTAISGVDALRAQVKNEVDMLCQGGGGFGQF